MMLVFDHKDCVGHEPGDVHTRVFQVLRGSPWIVPSVPRTMSTARAPRACILARVAGDALGLHNAYIYGLICIREEQVRLLVGAGVLTHVFCSCITVHFLRAAMWPWSQHPIVSCLVMRWSRACVQPCMRPSASGRRRTQLALRCLSVGEIGPRPHRTERRLSASSGGTIRDPRTSSQRSSCRCAGPAGAPARRPVLASGVLCVAQGSMAGSWEVHARPPLLLGAARNHPSGRAAASAAPLDADTCPVVALCVLRQPGGVLHRQNPTAS